MLSDSDFVDVKNEVVDRLLSEGRDRALSVVGEEMILAVRFDKGNITVYRTNVVGTYVQAVQKEDRKSRRVWLEKRNQ